MQRLERSLDNLLDTIADLQRTNRILAAALGAVLQRGLMSVETCDVIKSPEQLLDHISEYLSAYIVLTNINDLPITIAITWDEIQKLEQEGRLEAWIRSYWSEGTQAISIP